MTIRLILCNKVFDPQLPYQRVSRPSVFGNPFPLTNSSIKERDRVCDEYGLYFVNSFPKFEPALNNLLAIAMEYKVLQLVCFCSPLRCHGDTVAKYLIDELSKEGYDVIYEKKVNSN